MELWGVWLGLALMRACQSSHHGVGVALAVEKLIQQEHFSQPLEKEGVGHCNVHHEEGVWLHQEKTLLCR